jgi:ABC-type sugar transport system ATPase subunit
MLSMIGVTKEFSGIYALQNVDFQVLSGEVMALMGENGAGKSTLMKILAGVYTDWIGTISISQKEQRFKNTREAENAGIGIIYQELNLVPGLSVSENVFLGREPTRFGSIVDYSKMNKMAEEILSELHFKEPVTTLVSQLRVGHQQIVEIGKALSLDAKILIMDEPTSALSEKEAKILLKVVRQLRDRGVSIIYITHRIGEVFEIANRVTVLRDGCLVAVEDIMNVDRQKLIQMMVGRNFKKFFFRCGNPKEEIILKVKNLTRKNINPSKKALVEDVNFEVRKGEKLGIAGLLGAGRTELLESLFGIDPYNTTGTVQIGEKIISVRNPKQAIDEGIGFITEDRKGNGLVLSMDIGQNLTLAALESLRQYLILSRKKERDTIDKYIDKLSIQTNNPKNSINSLSGGNQQKVLLAKWLATGPKVLLLDEPTRGIDVGAKHQIYVLLSELANLGIAIIMASSELLELLAICDRIMVMREGKISAVFSRDEATQEKILDAAAPVS